MNFAGLDYSVLMCDGIFRIFERVLGPPSFWNSNVVIHLRLSTKHDCWTRNCQFSVNNFSELFKIDQARCHAAAAVYLWEFRTIIHIYASCACYGLRVNCFQLIDMQWSLGMSMASSNCRNLNSPFVAVLLKVAEPSGSVVERSFEMTIPEFKVGF